MRITLLYESPSGDGANVLTAEQLGAVHAAERRLWQWARDEGVCWADAACVCRPFDSLVSSLYPQINHMHVTMRPIWKLLRAPDSPNWNFKHKAALRSAIAGRQWTQA